MKIQLSEHFTYKKLLQFVFPIYYNDDFHIHLLVWLTDSLSPTLLEKALLQR